MSDNTQAPINTKTVQYFGIMDSSPEPDSVWGIRIPDLPGCFAGAGSLNEVILDAKSAIKEWLTDRFSKNIPLPNSSALADLQIASDETPLWISITVVTDVTDYATMDMFVEIRITSSLIERVRLLNTKNAS